VAAAAVAVAVWHRMGQAAPAVGVVAARWHSWLACRARRRALLGQHASGGAQQLCEQQCFPTILAVSAPLLSGAVVWSD